jgi:hypothetical protein
MPKLKLSVMMPTHSKKAIALVRDVTGLAIVSAAKRLAEGRSGWLITADLFKGDHDDRAAECERLIHGLRALGVEPYILYAPTSASWESVVKAPEKYVISPDVVLKVLREPVSDFD